MRRGRRGDVSRLRRFLFEAGMVTLPAHHRREGGPATCQARLAAVRAPEFRRTLIAYLDVASRSCDPAPSTSWTSALAIFGEFVRDHDLNLTSVSGLERHHIEAFLAWTATRAARGSHDHTKAVGPFVHAHAAIAVRGFLDDIWSWGWADTLAVAWCSRPTFPANPTRCPEHYHPISIRRS